MLRTLTHSRAQRTRVVQTTTGNAFADGNVRTGDRTCRRYRRRFLRLELKHCLQCIEHIIYLLIAIALSHRES